jgi:hypothetical protein
VLTAHEKSGQNVFKANKEKRVQPISHALKFALIDSRACHASNVAWNPWGAACPSQPRGSAIMPDVF